MVRELVLKLPKAEEEHVQRPWGGTGLVCWRNSRKPVWPERVSEAGVEEVKAGRGGEGKS